MTFDGAGSWNFGNDDARNIAIFAVDNSSSSHADNLKNNFLVLRKGRTYYWKLLYNREKICVNFVKQGGHFDGVYHDNSY